MNGFTPRHRLGARVAQSGAATLGALLVGPDGSILMEDHDTVLADRDITAHPELKLARWAAHHLHAEAVGATTMYTSCEPCEMCTGAIERAGLGRVVFALSDEQWQAATRAAPSRPVAVAVAYEGPALFEEAEQPSTATTTDRAAARRAIARTAKRSRSFEYDLHAEHGRFGAAAAGSADCRLASAGACQ